MQLNLTRKFKSTSQEHINTGDIEYIIKKAAGERTEIKLIETSRGGDINSSYVIHTSKHNERFFLKVENHNLITQFHAGQIEREEAGIRLMKKLNVPSPYIISCDKTKQDIGKNYIITEYIDSPLLSEVWENLSHEQQIQAKKDVLAIVDKCKSVEKPYFGDIYESGNRGWHTNWNDAFKRLAQILIGDCTNMGLLSKVELEIAETAMSKAHSEIRNSYTPCYNHMDLHWENILAEIVDDKLEIKAVLDYGNSMIGIPINDDCRLFTFFLLEREFYDEETPMRYDVSEDELFMGEFLYGLELVLFEGMIGQVFGAKDYLFPKCRWYLEK